MNLVKLDQKSSPHYFFDIARLHIEEIHHGFLPLLGEDFLSRLYYEMAQLSNTGLWIAKENDKILGFILGTSDFRKSYFKVFKKAWFALSMMGVRSLFKNKVFKKLPAILAYPFHQYSEEKNENKNQRNSNAELLSIGVHIDAQGKGVGKMLVLTFEQALVEWGKKGLYFVTTNLDDQNSNAFYRKMGFIPCGKQKHNDLILQVYEKEIPIHSKNQERILVNE